MREESKWSVFCYGTMTKGEFEESIVSLECRKAYLEEGDETKFTVMEDYDGEGNDVWVNLPLGAEVYLASWGNRIQLFEHCGWYYWAAET